MDAHKAQPPTNSRPDQPCNGEVPRTAPYKRQPNEDNPRCKHRACRKEHVCQERRSPWPILGCVATIGLVLVGAIQANLIKVQDDVMQRQHDEGLAQNINFEQNALWPRIAVRPIGQRVFIDVGVMNRWNYSPYEIVVAACLNTGAGPARLSSAGAKTVFPWIKGRFVKCGVLRTDEAEPHNISDFGDILALSKAPPVNEKGRLAYRWTAVVALKYCYSTARCYTRRVCFATAGGAVNQASCDPKKTD